VKIHVEPDVAQAGARAAAVIEEEVAAALEQRPTCSVAFSAGRAAAPMLAELARGSVDWSRIHVTQVDERVAPKGHPDRNLTMLESELLSRISIPSGHVHPMPVDDSDLRAACERLGQTLERFAGNPVELDVVHLGLGDDGHTASLPPGDPVLQVHDADVAVTDEYRGRRRMTLTYPALNRARALVWLVTGEAKADLLARMVAGDKSFPGGAVRQDRATIVADRDAAAALGPALLR
jgi:6-phosphogluconolactonase